MQNQSASSTPLLTFDDVRALPLPSGRYFGPCSGDDVAIAFQLFGDQCTDFLFCDQRYSHNQPEYLAGLPKDWARIEQREMYPLPGPTRTWWYSRSFRAMSRTDRLRRPDLSVVTAEFRRDLAHEVLVNEFGPRSISCFLHVGDSTGEGGSDLWFLGASRAHDPWSGGDPEPERACRLLSELAPRLADGALVVTDGSNTDHPFMESEPFERCDVRWEPVGVLEDREPSIGWGSRHVWRVQRLDAGVPEGDRGR
jgi:hypothetical protein